MAQRNTALATAAAICFSIPGSAALADVTSQQVWNDWKGYMEGFGYTLQADETVSGDSLTIDNLSAEITLPEDQGTASMSLGQVVMTDMGDGTVSITLPAKFPIHYVVDPAEGESVDAKIDYSSSGSSIIVSGNPEDITYSYEMAEAGFVLAELIVEGEPVDLNKMAMTMTGVSGSSSAKKGNLRNMVQRFTSGPIAFDIDVDNPEDGSNVKMSGGYDSLDFEGTGAIPLEMDATNLAAMMRAGFAFDGSFRFGAGGADFTFADQEEMVEGTSKTGGGHLDVSMDEKALRYAGAATDYDIQLSGGELPFPVEMAMQQTKFDLLLPVAKGDEEQDFAFALTMGDFTMSDLIWSLFDPGAKLPRDPATVVVDTAGKVKLLVDLMDPEAMEAAGAEGAEPAELHALDLKSLIISIAGAELTGNGGFTFDNSDKMTFDGMPAPTGEIDLKLVGGNGLLDKLVEMGLLPEDQAMGARMMMGLFAVPGAGEDELTSKIEVSGDGQIKANGQRIK